MEVDIFMGDMVKVRDPKKLDALFSEVDIRGLKQAEGLTDGTNLLELTSSSHLQGLIFCFFGMRCQ